MLAVVEQRPRTHILAASPTARARGIEAGMRVAGALAIAPDLVLRNRNPDAEISLLTEIAHYVGGFSPAVSLDPPDCVLLEVSSCLRLFDGLAKLIDRLTCELNRLGLQVRLAAAPTPLAARWLAITRPGQQITATDPAWTDVLSDLPIELIVRDGKVSAAKLNMLLDIGVERIGAIKNLPRDGLARRDAIAISTVIAQARGELPDPRPWHQTPPTHASRLILPAPVDTTEHLLFACKRLLVGLTAWLTARLAAVDRCLLFLEHEDQPDTLIEIVTGEPGRCEAQWGVLLREHLARLELKAPVRALRLCANQPVFQPARSQDLFGDPNQTRDSAQSLIDRLCARLGKNAVFGLSMQPGYRPEAAWFATRPGSPVKLAKPLSGLRPAWLLDEPKALATIDPLRLLSGPERIESGWWDDHDTRRDYYVARNADNALWWVFRSLDESGGWYMHGYFA